MILISVTDRVVKGAVQVVINVEDNPQNLSVEQPNRNQ